MLCEKSTKLTTLHLSKLVDFSCGSAPLLLEKHFQRNAAGSPVPWWSLLHNYTILTAALKCYSLKCSLQEHQEDIYFAMFEKADISTDQHCSFAKLRLISKGLYTSQSSHRTAEMTTSSIALTNRLTQLYGRTLSSCWKALKRD